MIYKWDVYLCSFEPLVNEDRKMAEAFLSSSPCTSVIQIIFASVNKNSWYFYLKNHYNCPPGNLKKKTKNVFIKIYGHNNDCRLYSGWTW